MFGRFGFGELMLIFGIILLVLGPAKLPALAKSMGQALKEFKKGSQDVTKKFDELVEEPMQEAKAAVEQSVSGDETK